MRDVIIRYIILYG